MSWMILFNDHEEVARIFKFFKFSTPLRNQWAMSVISMAVKSQWHGNSEAGMVDTVPASELFSKNKK